MAINNISDMTKTNIKPDKDTKDTIMYFRVDEAQRHSINQVMRETNLKASELIRTALWQYITKN